jgi:lambda family phage minor tail protein L
MSIEQEVQQPVVSAFIELFQLDIQTETLTSYYYTPMTNGASSVQWNGQTYLPFPINIENISMSSEGAPTRPTLTIANILPGRLFGTLAFLYGDLVGNKITYTRTFANYLGISSDVCLKPLRYTIAKKIGHNKLNIVFELRSPFDRERNYLPKRQMLKKDFPGLGVTKKAF